MHKRAVIVQRRAGLYFFSYGAQQQYRHADIPTHTHTHTLPAEESDAKKKTCA